MDCGHIERDDIIEKYLSGRLGAAEQEEFEVHYFSCAKCRERLQVSRLLQEKLWEHGDKILPRRKASHRAWVRRRVWVFSAGAVALIVAAAALWWQFMGPGRGAAGMKEIPSSLIMLSRFEPPTYIPPALRGAKDDAAERFGLGMTNYVEGRYGEAISDLRAAAGLNPNRAGIRFFLGICLLLAEQTDAGIEELKAAIGLGDSAYLEEAHFYLAKAYLGKGDIGGAKRELNWVLESGSNLNGEANRILAQLQ
jgi:tetratricopeptide (TPR) repeat protein